MVFGNQNWSTVTFATTPEALLIRDWPVVSGRPLTQADVDGAAKVCLLGQTVAENLFGEMDPVGQVVRVKKFPFTVVGVLADKGQTTWGQDQDDVVYVPLTTGQRLLFGQQFPGMVRSISVQAIGADTMKVAEEQITQLLRQRHRIRANQDNDFSVRNLTEAFSAAEESARVMSILLGAIASISLLVGGIGIMNIMLVSVTERTREIGIRMAVGARGKDILWQFLVEALVLSLIGGIIGIILGVSASQLISQFFKWPTLISAPALLLSFSFAGGVGIFFGFYPARKAAQSGPDRSPAVRVIPVPRRKTARPATILFYLAAVKAYPFQGRRGLFPRNPSGSRTAPPFAAGPRPLSCVRRSRAAAALSIAAVPRSAGQPAFQV